MGLTENVTKDTSPNAIFVPMLMRMDTPMAAMNRTGSIHDNVDSTRSSTMTGTRMATATSTCSIMLARIYAVSAASPETALPAPSSSTSARSAGTASLSAPSASVTWNSALPFR